MKILLNFFNLDVGCKDTLAHRRVIIIKSALFLVVPVFIFFGFMNIFFIHQYIIAILDSFAALVSIHAIYILQSEKDLPKAAKIATFNVMLFILLFVYTNGSSHFGLIWTIFLPIFAILVNGKKIGLYISIFFYSILYYMAFTSIGLWDDGRWMIQDFMRLMFSSIILIYIMYMNEKALESSDKKLIETRAREKDYIESLHLLSITDTLTDLYNRRYFNEMAPKLISLSKREKHALIFFILDIDYFKQYNDTYGHIKGDEALQKISKALKDHIQRGDDFIFRLGGEEFAGIVLSEDIEECHIWIKSICKIIEDLKIEHSSSTISPYITVSVGVTTVYPDDGLNIEQIYALADKALYAAKEDGRNHTKFSNN